MTKLRVMAAVALAVTFAFAGCGGGESVGSNDNLAFEEQEAGRLGELEEEQEPTPAPATPPPAPAATPPPKAQAPAATPVPAQAFEVKIIAGGQGFDPFAFAVSKGTRIKVVNTTDRSATFTSEPAGAFDSGPIAPGASWEYVANTPGTFNFRDKERPFAQGQMEVRG